jgi:hypothetical protein
MEKIQERALRFIYNDYVLNYEELLEKSKMPSLKVRRVWQLKRLKLYINKALFIYMI